MRVRYRFDKYGEYRECTAILPDVPANPGRVTCYAHVGQHGEADRAWVREKTRPATPAEYEALHRELSRIYAPETLRIVARIASR